MDVVVSQVEKVVSSTGALGVPEVESLRARLSTPEEIRDFHSSAKVAAQEFKARYKDPSGKEPRQELLLTPAQEGLVNEWLTTPEGGQKIATLSDRVMQFVTETIDRGHPGHDKRHVLYKDPISGLCIALEEDLSPTRQLFIMPSLLHDVGRLFEPALFDKPQSGTLGVDHTILGFAITQELLGDALSTHSRNTELAVALKNLHDEILNAVLDHQSGNSRSSAIAQFVQRSDREQLVGYEALHRFISFDVGFYGLDIREVANEESKTRLPLPGASDDRHLFEHAEFYLRNLFENVGVNATVHTDRGKIETGRFLWLAATPMMRFQIFYPEIRRDFQQDIPTDKTKKPLSVEMWRAISECETPELIERLDAARGQRTLAELTNAFIHPEHATRTDVGSSGNWNTIITKLDSLNPEEDRRFGRALMYGLELAARSDAADRAVVGAALERFKAQPHGALYKVAELVAALQRDPHH